MVLVGNKCSFIYLFKMPNRIQETISMPGTIRQCPRPARLPGDGTVKPLLLQQLGPQGMERGGSGHGGEGGWDPATRGVQRERAHVEGVPMATRTLVLVITVCQNQYKSCFNIYLNTIQKQYQNT
jgi:hypothetical protein